MVKYHNVRQADLKYTFVTKYELNYETVFHHYNIKLYVCKLSYVKLVNIKASIYISKQISQNN